MDSAKTEKIVRALAFLATKQGDVETALRKVIDACNEELETPKQEEVVEITCTISVWPNIDWNPNDYKEFISEKISRSGMGCELAHLKILGVETVIVDQKPDGSYF